MPNHDLDVYLEPAVEVSGGSTSVSDVQVIICVSNCGPPPPPPPDPILIAVES
jgi:hypothetical protein